MKNSIEILKLGVTLGLICLIAGLALSVTYSVTKDVIAEQQAKALILAQKEIFPEASEFKKVEMSEAKIDNATIRELYEAISADSNIIGYIATAFTPGYGGNIVFVLGMSKDGSIKGIKITEQTETPGLGANIVKPQFLEQFVGKVPKDEFIVKKDIKPITSATISSRSIANGIKDVLNYINRNLVGSK